MAVYDPQRRVLGLGVFFKIGATHIGAKIKQVVLYPLQHHIQFPACMQPRHTQSGIQLIRGAIGGDPHRMFGHPRTIAERGFAVIPGFGIYSIENNHNLRSFTA